MHVGAAAQLSSVLDLVYEAPFRDGAWRPALTAIADFVHAEWKAATDYLFDADEDLYFRDSRFFDMRDAKGRKLFWSRGNGWVMGGLVRMLELLPADHASRPRFVQQFREMADKMVTLQQPDGFWRGNGFRIVVSG